MDSPASMDAARCTTPSMRWSVKMRSRAAAVGGVSYDEFGARGDGGFVAVAQIVEDDDIEALFEELGGDHASDVSGASGD